MQAIVHRRYGEPSEILAVADVEPPSLGTGQVLVRVKAAPLLFGNLLAVRGRYRLPGDVSVEPPNGGRQGYEGVGVIEAVGEGVAPARGLSVGQRVAFLPAPGAWAEKVAVPAEFVTPVPDAIPDTVAAQLHVNPITAGLLYRAALEAGVAEGGDRGLLIDAGSSSVAKLVATIAERHEVPTVSIVRRRDTIDRLSQLLPKTTFVATDDDGWREKLQATAPGGGFYVGLDAVGGSVGSTVLDSIAPGGTLITYGDLSGEPLQANALSFAMRGTRVRGLVIGQWFSSPEADRRVDIAQALELARTRPELFSVAAEYPLAAVRDAARALEQRGRQGLVLLRP